MHEKLEKGRVVGGPENFASDDDDDVWPAQQIAFKPVKSLMLKGKYTCRRGTSVTNITLICAFLLLVWWRGPV